MSDRIIPKSYFSLLNHQLTILKPVYLRFKEKSMSRKRIDMKKVREILRLKFECQLSNRNISTCLKVGSATVSEILSRFKLSELGWPLPEDTSDQVLSKALYHTKTTSADKIMPDFLKCTQERELTAA